jgi:mannose-6-phosphate isomerase-like protein (cupin superfamily)
MIDVAAPRRVPKPWGHELIIAHTDRYVGKLIHIDRGQALSRQYHVVKDETLFVQAGTLILEIGPRDAAERVVLTAGSGFHVVPGTIHRFQAPEDEDCDLVEMSTPELDDVVRLEDRYGREGTSAP